MDGNIRRSLHAQSSRAKLEGQETSRKTEMTPSPESIMRAPRPWYCRCWVAPRFNKAWVAMKSRRIPGVAMERVSKLAAGTALALQASLSWAQEAVPQTYPYGGHMMWGGGWFGMFFGLLSMFVLLLAVFGGFALVVRWFGAPRHDGRSQLHSHTGRTPLDILKERFARGEIDKEEFEERRRVLGE